MYAIRSYYVSAKDSPFVTEVFEISVKPITFPPSLFIAVSKESLVLVDGS